MTDDPHAIRRKRLLFRSAHRGNKENDILLGQFAKAEMAELDAAELDQFEALLKIGDNELYDWLSGRAEPPAEHDTPLLARLRAFRPSFPD
jgi:antitoxin CptB